MDDSAIPAGVAAAHRRARDAGFALSCEPAVGRLLATLAAAAPLGGSILEMGTGVGTGTAWIVHGLGTRDDVRVTTVEVDEPTAAIARTAAWPSCVSLRTATPICARSSSPAAPA